MVPAVIAAALMAGACNTLTVDPSISDGVPLDVGDVQPDDVALDLGDVRPDDVSLDLGDVRPGHAPLGLCAPDAGDGPPSGWTCITAGMFTMGSPAEELGRSSNETQHTVTLTRDFYLQSTEVTQGQWRALMGTSPSHFSSCGDDGRDDCPVESVNWWEAAAYANALSRSEGLDECYVVSDCTGTLGAGCEISRWCHGDYRCGSLDFLGLDCAGYRLPTESEWEYAARAGTMTATYLGDLQSLYWCDPQPNLEPIAWYCGNASGTTRAVAGRDANARGLHDMLGNVWEWTWDLYGPYPGSTTDPTGASGAYSRVLRGGSWSDFAQYARAAYRYGANPAYRASYLGFRLARTAHPPEGKL